METGSKPAAGIGTALYMVSAGYLSSASLFFHQGKPLTNFAAILALFVAGYLQKQVAAVDSRPGVPRFPGVVVAYFVTVFWFLLLADATALYCYAIVPIWNYRYFWPARRTPDQICACAINAAIYAIPAAMYALFVFVITPHFWKLWNPTVFNVGTYLGKGLYGGDLSLSVGHVLQDCTTLGAAALTPWCLTHQSVPIGDAVRYSPGLLALLACFASSVGVSMWRRQGGRETAVKSGVLIAAFIAFQTYVSAHHHQNLVVTGYYYGGIFSILVATGLTFALDGICNRRWGIAIAWAAVAYLLAVQLSNFRQINESWIRHNNFKIVNGVIPKEAYDSYLPPYWKSVNFSAMRERYRERDRDASYMPEINLAQRGNSYARINDLWRLRDNGHAAYLSAKPLACREWWAAWELYCRNNVDEVRGR
jgi:hypothetical protein